MPASNSEARKRHKATAGALPDLSNVASGVLEALPEPTEPTTPETFPSESAAVQAWINGDAPIYCRCGCQVERVHGVWYHQGDRSEVYCKDGRSIGPSIADSECGTCGRTWDSVVTPTPAARCPFEYDHDDEPAQVDEATLAADIAEAARLIRSVLDADDVMGGHTPGLVASDAIDPRALLEAALRALGQ